MTTDQPTHHRACIQCHGEGWLTGPDVKGWPSILPCPECRPVPAARLARGAYAPDAPVQSASDAESVMAEAVPRTALWPREQTTSEWPPPGQRTTEPHPPERRNTP